MPVVDAIKFATGPKNFDKGSMRRLREKKVVKMKYENKFKRNDSRRFTAIKMSQKIYRKGVKKKKKSIKPFASRNIQYIKKPIMQKNVLLPNIKLTKNH